MPLSRIGPFALEETLDGSGESNVLRGLHIERKLNMAVKLLPREVAHSAMGNSNFAEDVKRLQKLVHPGIARIYGGAVEQGQPYLVLELISGESLREQLDRRGKLPWEVAVDIADGICLALHSAHQSEFVHQRLTPSRVLVQADASVKLIGFDCVWADRDEVLGLRSPMNVAHYLSPEQYRGKQSSTSPQCDLFSLGVLLFECLTGELPWSAESPSDLIQARRDSEAPRVSTMELDCPVWLDALVSRLLAVKRSDRLSSAEETHRAIVTAKSKAEAGTGAAQHAWSGKTGVLDAPQDRSELRRLKQARPKRKPKEPFYEKAWFLVLSLIAVIGVGVWVMWPLNEEELYSRAQPLMESESTADWKVALEKYLRPLKERFPETEYADEILAFEEQYAMIQAEKRVKFHNRIGYKPESEVEKRYIDAWKKEQAGDHYTAWKKYEAVINFFGDKEDIESRAFVNLARRQVDSIKALGDVEEGLGAFLESRIKEARSLVANGKLLKARGILDSLITLYADNQEVRAIVKTARDFKDELDVQFD